jgi:hypothetical protein
MGKAKTFKVRPAGRYVWRDTAGQFQGVIIPDPVVRPRGVSVRSIKRAVEKTVRTSGSSQQKLK